METKNEKRGPIPVDAGAKSKGQRPTKPIPTDRIGVAKQFEILRAVGVLSGAAGKVASTKEIGDAVELAEGTIGLAFPFLVEVGFLQRVDGGYLPSPDVSKFATAFGWNPESAPAKLAPPLADSWFGQALLPRLTMKPIEESKAIEILAEASTAAPAYARQLKAIIEMMVSAQLIQRDGTVLSRPSAPAHDGKNDGAGDKLKTPQVQNEKPEISTGFVRPTEQVVQFHVDVRVNMNELAGWTPERITSFFAGIAQVMAAKGNLERDGS